MSKRVTARVSDETAEKARTWADRLGISQSQFLSMAIQAGIGSIIRAVSPEEAMRPEQWAAIVRAAQDQGVIFQGGEDEKKTLP